MLIQCPRCRTRAQVAEDALGARVRCSECGRVWVAGARRQQKSPVGLVLGVGGGVLALAVLVLVVRDESASDAPIAQVEAAPAAKPTPPANEWESPLVQAAVGVHRAAARGDAGGLRPLLFGPGLLARTDPEARPDARAFGALGYQDRERLYEAAIADLVGDEGDTPVAAWRPYDFQIAFQDDDAAVVRLAVTPRAPEGGAEKRWIEWHLARQEGRWRAWRWQRWLSPEELAALHLENVQVELSDGSLVVEREPEPMGHLDETPPALRERIDELYRTLIDRDLTTEAAEAGRILADIGRPAIPILLNGLYETPITDEASAIRVNQIVGVLRNITGEHKGFAPQLAQGSGTGTTEEWRQSAVRQWFAWWNMNQYKFEARSTEDGLEGKIQLSNQEKRWLERHPD